MRVYTVHVPPATRHQADPVLVKEGFSWPAFFFGPLWALAHRMWLVTVALVALDLIISVVLDAARIPPVTQAVISLAVAVLIGAHGNDWRRRSLDRRGFRDAGVVAGRNIDEALARYLDATVTHMAVPRPRTAPVAPPPLPLAGV
ncbi:MAG TPA: DUF2628 domain-containing protein [Alphaproteobacteria bacterium]|jgi:hypothetical protein|nr:DUF2628 domain-containing protein [Alphaproteobacteria bacterium]